NGAKADPVVTTTRPPNTSDIKMIGSSQYFFRTRRNCQSSCKKAIIGSSELTLHRTLLRTAVVPYGPVARSACLASQAQHVSSRQSKHKAGRKKRGHIHNAITTG